MLRRVLSRLVLAWSEGLSRAGSRVCVSRLVLAWSEGLSRLVLGESGVVRGMAVAESEGWL
jgi:hypothetical protein